ncbi:MAG: EAL domain-containing protein, partial [Ruminococcus sp.]|nr:EAL domain-containing protein [Ruminococcus sp.]
EKLKQTVNAAGGFVCRKESDMFLIYVPSGFDFKEMIDNASVELKKDESSNSRVRLRAGVYKDADKSVSIEARFDRAKMAADIIRNNLTKNVEYYDSSLREKELYIEQLVDDFRMAIDKEHFVVYFQPKFDIRPREAVLMSAEALVRWNHPTFGMISPGTFIPLFEGNGLIQELDLYVWMAAAKQIKDWKDRLGYSIPVSVNVSRIDLYDPDLIDILLSIVKENDLSPSELLLEITESAYTEEGDSIVDTIVKLRDLGFRIEMDDFGSGYSSLNMLSTLPIDALKLDMKFLKSAFSVKKDTRMLEVIIDMAKYLGVPVIAEGVETKEQLNALKSIGCDIVQGYYFSRPVPALDFEQFIEKRKEQAGESKAEWELMSIKQAQGSLSGISFSGIAQALAADYFSIYYVDTQTDWFIEYSSDADYQSLGIEKGGEDFFNLSRTNIKRVIYPEDQERFLQVFTKENILRELETFGTFTISYRLLFDGTPTYVSMKATRMADKNDKHIVIGVNNIDAQMKREEEHIMAVRLANEDSLTGVKSKHAYSEEEKNLNDAISSGKDIEFAIAVCDVYGLKKINDTLGHKAGDKYIIDAAKMICDTFKESFVYRIGGDEFTVILTGEDYKNRDALLDSIMQMSRANTENGGVVIACGISEFLKDSDNAVSSVFGRADEIMYKNKKLLKGIK